MLLPNGVVFILFVTHPAFKFLFLKKKLLILSAFKGDVWLGGGEILCGSFPVAIPRRVCGARLQL